MIRNAVIIGLGATLLAACVPVQQPQGPNPPPTPAPQAEAPTPAEPQEGQPLAPVDVRRLTCRTLTGASDDDKAYATSCLMGYRSALVHSRTIEIKRIEAVEEAALADCVGKPDALATKVFAAALQRIGPGGELREPPRPHHREPPSQAMPGAPAPEQQPPTPNQTPAIQYTPAPTTPTPTQTAPPPAPTPAAPPPEPAPPAQPTLTEPTPSQVVPGPAVPPPAPTQTTPPPGNQKQ